MDHMEQMMLRMKELQPKIPSWAKAEQMEICTPQSELWKYDHAEVNEITHKPKIKFKILKTLR